MNEYLLKIKSCGLYLNSMGGSAPVELSRVVSEGPTRALNTRWFPADCSKLYIVTEYNSSSIIVRSSQHIVVFSTFLKKKFQFFFFKFFFFFGFGLEL